MDNRQFPQQEESGIPPEALTDLPVSEGQEELPVLEDIPQMEELTFQDDIPVIEEITFVPEAPKPLFPEEHPNPLPQPEEVIPPTEPEPPLPAETHPEIPVAEEPASEEAAPAVEEAFPEEPVPVVEAPIPEVPAPVVEEPIPEAFPEPEPQPEISLPEAKARLEEAAEKLMEVEAIPEILPDTQAMDANGLLGHGEAEPLFDMSLLDDPDLRIPEEAADQAYRDDGKEFEDMLHAPVKEEKPTPPPRQANKGRPKRKKGEGLLGIPNILVTFVWLALIVMIGVTAGRMLWVCAADVLAFGREDKVVTVTVYEADSM